ncbi:tRNA (N(6)-L-threonylcarbamoyladenosine(37)-C(2))-methylthiotransferase MtaB [Candidatus Desulfarcum epimagneticum]|uniref:tRNA (N(6)-L-threonylcarbamoyladenosine(37)-C(2))-methylthiotransferase MtaB n=1 Tax=uncultured Desulfobacteraceae bacterium TaxID=218296 RepID=A0A484HDP3_9BACT|nr:tRNA (N(6)-L-threonylcarbamoyladenosine(37)-C(2))-methylthiotransferase MtaB [uncultured Desulfobacteraceae bacterium]
MKKNPMKTFKMITLGCRVNQCESDALGGRLMDSGLSPSRPGAGADVCVINTCAVTQKAAMQSRQAIRKAIRRHPGAAVIVSGCYAQTRLEEARKIPGVHYVAGNADKHKIPDLLKTKPDPGAAFPVVTAGDIRKQRRFAEIPGRGHSAGTRPSLKIQDGCDAFCSYCVVPLARGPSRSMPVDHVMERLEQFRENGRREVVLSGIHLGRYGLDLSPKTSLLALLSRIEKEKPAERIRLSSIEPQELGRDIIRLVAESDIICPHFHIPLQSGDDAVLKRMGRRYAVSLFRDRVRLIRDIIPEAAIGADVLAGFPGETDRAFENTRSLVEALPLSYLHVFPFSPRRGTRAWSFPDRVGHETIARRCAALRELGERKRRDFYAAFEGQTVSVLFENRRREKTGRLKGVSPHYLKVLADGGDARLNAICDVRITGMEGPDLARGEIVS